MKLKGRTILVMCLVLFGGYAIFDHFNDQKKADKDMEASRLMTLNFEQVNEIWIKRPSEIIHIQRDVDGWRLTEPLQDLADNEAADDLVKSAFTERIIEVVKEGEDIDWKIYGLETPVGTITYMTADGKQNEYQVSALKNFEDNVYARRDQEQRVLLVNSIWQTRVGKTAAELRDRRFLRHKIAAVDELQLQNSKGLLHLKRKDGVWVPAPENKGDLDQNKVRALLTSIAEAKASEILPAGSKSPTATSLFTLNLTMDTKNWSAKVSQAADKKIYAKVTEPDFNLKMEPGSLDNLISMSVEDLKAKPESGPEKEK